MLYRIIKLIAWAVLTAALLILSISALMLLHVSTTTVYNTPWGKVDADTARIGFMEPWSHEPCYEAYKEVNDSDVIRYYFFKSRDIYYKADHDSSGAVRIRLYYPKGMEKDGEVCTGYFRNEDIFIR